MTEQSKSQSSGRPKHEIHHLLILDKSGSMGSVVKETISGFNENLVSIRGFDDPNIDQHVSVVLFDAEVEMPSWRVKADKIEDLNDKTYILGSTTALYDAIGMGVAKLRTDIGDKINDKNANVIVTVFTDGGENSSNEFSDFSKLKAMMDELRSTRMWTFTFIGCSEDGLGQAADLGFGAGATMAYVAGGHGTKAAMSATSRGRDRYMMNVASAVDSRAKGLVDDDEMLGAISDAGESYFDEADDPADAPDSGKVDDDEKDKG
jgi:hypothetical protein